jgi:hypothetical protein
MKITCTLSITSKCIVDNFESRQRERGKDMYRCMLQPTRGSKYENPHFFEELESEVLEIKSTMGELDIIVMGDLSA